MQRGLATSAGIERRRRTAAPAQTAQRPQSCGIGVVELLLQRAHQAAAVGAEGGHRLLLGAAQRGDVRVAVAVVGPGAPGTRDQRRARAADRALDVQHLQHRLDARRVPRLTCAHQLVASSAVAAAARGARARGRRLARRERLLDEEVLDAAVLGAAQEHDLGAVDRAARRGRPAGSRR